MTKKCRYCQTDVPKQAALCVKCNRFQDWRRFLNFSSTILALLIALLTVASSLGPGAVKLIQSPKINVVFAVVAQSSGSFEVVAKNNGNREAMIGTVEIGFHTLGFSPMLLDADERTIKPSETIALRVIASPEVEPGIRYALHLTHQQRSDFQSGGELAQDWVPRSGNLLAFEVIDEQGCSRFVEAVIPKSIFEQYLIFHIPERAIPGPGIEEPKNFIDFVKHPQSDKQC